MKGRTTSLLYALVIGAAITIIPFMVSKITVEGRTSIEWLQTKLMYLMLPGSILGIIVAGLSMNVNRWVIYFSNCLFYTFIFYLFIRRKKKKG
jgi:hypothetical protein